MSERKLYEYSTLVKVHVVVAAESEEAARAELDKTLSPEGWCRVGDIINTTDIDLFDERALASEEDDAHLSAKREQADV